MLADGGDTSGDSPDRQRDLKAGRPCVLIVAAALASAAAIAAASASGNATGAVLPPALSALCPKGTAGEITVCADHEALRSPYRLPEDPDRQPTEGSQQARSISSERNGLLDHDAGGIGSCSAVGAAGASGCGFQRHKRWVDQRAGAKDPRGPAFDKPDH